MNKNITSLHYLGRALCSRSGVGDRWARPTGAHGFVNQCTRAVIGPIHSVCKRQHPDRSFPCPNWGEPIRDKPVVSSRSGHLSTVYMLVSSPLVLFSAECIISVFLRNPCRLGAIPAAHRE